MTKRQQAGIKPNCLNCKSLVKAGWVFSPFLLGFYPVLFLYARNKHELIFAETARAMLAAEVLVLLTLILLKVFYKNLRLSLILTSIFSVLFFSYGHIYRILKSESFFNGIPVRHRFILPVYLLVGLLALMLGKRKPKVLYRPQTFLSVLAVLLVALPGIDLAAYTARTQRTDQSGSSSLSLDMSRSSLELSMDAPPDVYFIILDGFGRGDVLRRIYDSESEHFIQALQERGFSIATQSHANYAHTALSLAATLNLQYIQDLGLDLQNADYPDIYRELLTQSYVRSTFETLGYEIIALDSGWKWTQWEDADTFLDYDEQRSRFTLSPFESMLLDSTMLKAILDHYPLQAMIPDSRSPIEEHRQRIQAAFDDLPQIAKWEGPKFIFAHVLSPHRPYVFNAQGGDRQNDANFTLLDVSSTDNLQQDRLLYRDQMMYISRRMLETLDAIFENSAHPPIVILQSDHGPGLGISWGDTNQVNEEQIFDRMAILNAVYVPDDCQSLFYDRISSINTFPVIFNCILVDQTRLLEDHAYFSGYDAIHDFQAVDDIMHKAQP